MFEPLPEKPSHFAGHWIKFIALGGGIAGVATAGWLFGEEGLQSNAILFGSFAVGALLGLVVGWRVVMPSGPPS